MSTKDYLVQNMVSELVGYLMKDFGWDIQSAMKAVYHSALFQKLDDAEIELSVKSRSKNFMISVDGRSQSLHDTTTIKLCRAKYSVKVIKMRDTHFYDTLRNKMMWGADKR
mgnify:CR=1 FL=1